MAFFAALCANRSTFCSFTAKVLKIKWVLKFMWLLLLPVRWVLAWKIVEFFGLLSFFGLEFFRKCLKKACFKYGCTISRRSMFCSHRNFGWFTNACIIADEWFTLEERSTRIVCPRLQMLWVVLLRLVVVSVAALLACVLIISFLSYRVSFFCFNLRWRRKRLK